MMFRTHVHHTLPTARLLTSPTLTARPQSRRMKPLRVALAALAVVGLGLSSLPQAQALSGIDHAADYQCHFAYKADLTECQLAFDDTGDRLEFKVCKFQAWNNFILCINRFTSPY